LCRRSSARPVDANFVNENVYKLAGPRLLGATVTDSAEPAASGFSSPKKRILADLKRRPGASLREIAEGLGVSKVAALKHLARLESEGWVERFLSPEGVGRPRLRFRLRPDAARLFPEAYAELSVWALEFVEERLGRDAVSVLLQQRTHAVADRHRARFEGKTLPARVEELARVRQEGGYMAEVGERRKSSIEMREHNCPILAVAGRYPEACEIERRLFESLLHANVSTTHRVVAGDAVCRFLIRPEARRT
jgi:predicted ArsR family transcriptional regulator